MPLMIKKFVLYCVVIFEVFKVGLKNEKERTRGERGEVKKSG